MLTAIIHSENGIAMIPEGIFERLFNLEESTVFGLRITNGEKNVYIGCMPHNEGGNEIYIPKWVRDNLDGSNEVDIERVELDAFPRAKTIRVKVLENALYYADIRDEIERMIYDFKFIQQHIILNIVLDKLGGYEGEIFIESVIDEDGIYCDGPALLGEEVELDIGEPLERLVEYEPPEELVEEPPLLPEPEPEPEPVPEVPLAPVIPTIDELTRIREARLRRFCVPSSSSVIP